MLWMAGNTSFGVSTVQSPPFEMRISGLGAISAPTTMLLKSVQPARRLAAVWQPPPWLVAEIMLTGAATLIRSSTAIRKNVWVPPPDAPVAAIRFGSTSGSDVRKSVALMLFQRCIPIEDPMFHKSWRASSQS